MDAPCYPRKDKILQDMLRTNKTLRQTAHKTKTEQDKMGKQCWRRRRFLKRKCPQDNWNKDIEAGRAPLEASERRTWIRRLCSEDLLREPLQRHERRTWQERNMQETFNSPKVSRKHPDRFRPIAVFDDDEEKLLTQMRIMLDSTREKQPSRYRVIQHLEGSGKSKRVVRT